MSPDQQLERINRDTIRFGFPGPEFNPLTAEKDELLGFGIPPKPDEETQPALFAYWVQMFTPPIAAVDVQFSYAYSRSDNFRRAGAIAGRTRQQASRNWSGASITPRDGRMFTEVVGTWRVPAVLAPPADGKYRSSTWIGLDGQRSYLDATLPQIGTGQHVDRVGGVATHVTESWVQWWPSREELTIGALPTSPGDRIFCWLTVLSPTWVHLLIENVDAPIIKKYAAFEWLSYDIPWPDPTSPLIQPKVSGATAEWIMERQTKQGSTELHELPIYDEVVFGCIANTALEPGDSVREEKLIGPTLIHMYKFEDDPHRAVVISTAERLGDHSIRTFYR
jgi:hypothetical protein